MEQNKELTALQYFTTELASVLDLVPGSKLENWYNELVNTAMHLEREQIKKAFYNGSFQITENEIEYRKACANNYYLLTYNKK